MKKTKQTLTICKEFCEERDKRQEKNTHNRQDVYKNILTNTTLITVQSILFE